MSSSALERPSDRLPSGADRSASGPATSSPQEDPRLADERAFNATVLAMMPAALWVLDERKLIVDANAAATRLLGGSPVGQPISALLGESGPLAPQSEPHDVSLTRLDGERVPVGLSVRFVPGDRRQIWIAVDRSDQLQLEGQLRHSHKLEAIGSLAAGLAHELNTPVQFILNNLCFLEDAYNDLLNLIDVAQRIADGGPPSPHTEQFKDLSEEYDLGMLRADIPGAMNALRIGAARVTKIVKAMKAFSHPEHSEKHPFDINEGIRTVAEIAEGEYRVVARLELELGELPTVWCHGDDLNTVFLNLIVNAAHAIESANRDQGLISIQTRAHPEAIEVAVADNGCGIPEEVRHRVFEPFFTTKAVGKGTGQGLTMAHSIIHGLGGSIRFETEAGEGTTFFLTIPKTDESPDETT